LNYNVTFELAALPFIATLLIFVLVRYRDRTKQDKFFINLIFFTMMTDLLDVVLVYITNLKLASSGVIIVLNTVDHVFAVCSSFSFVKYVYAFVDYKADSPSRRVMTFVNQGILVFTMILYMQNFITGNILDVDSRGVYYEGPLFMFATYLLPSYFLIYATAIIVVYNRSFRKLQLVSVLAGIGIIVFSALLQMFVLTGYLIVYFASSLAIFMIFLSHATPDYYKLEKTNEELRRSREEEQQAKLKAIAADEAKTRFLSQMSHEIRTPINAIMGYNEIIMEDTGEPETREYSRKARLAARRLLDFFEGMFGLIDIGGSEELLRSIADGTWEEESAETQLPDEETAEITVAQDHRILVVDDTEMNVDLLVRILKGMGFMTDTASDGEKGIEKIRNNSYDLIFMDHMMPVMDGMEAMRILRGEHLCDDTPVVMLTANTIKGEREKYINSGFAEYVPKPFTSKSIKEVLMKILPIDDEFMNRSSWEAEWQELQKELPFLRLAKAREYFRADAEMYSQTLKDFAMTGLIPKMEEYIEKGDYYNYRACLCTAKDSSLLIGADQIADQAAALEKLYRRGSIEELKVKHIIFADKVRKLLRQLAGALNLTETETDAVSGLTQSDSRPMILVIDDDPVLCEQIRQILSHDYRVETVASGEEGIVRAQEEAPALILLDVNLLSMNGFDVIRALSLIEETSEIPVVFMTADESGEAEVKGFRSGGADFVRKPFIPEVLIRRVGRIVELSALQKHLRHEISRRTEKIGNMSREVMLALSKAVDAKDKYTNDHSQRVAKYSAWIARQLGKTKQEQDSLYIEGLLHDVGKIGVHEEIINKPGPLTDEEYEEVKSHCVTGYDILKVITEMPDAAKAARWHHERYDGKGYPDGLAGTDIPENARIICVADAYDAMTSRRAYQALKPQAEVRAEILRCKGTQFDPDIADAMIRIIDEDKNYKLHG